MAVHDDFAGAGIDDAADDADERGLAGAVGSEQRKDLAAPDLQVHVVECLEARCVALGKAGDGNDGIGHAGHDT